jgi:hypothetical protein
MLGEAFVYSCRVWASMQDATLQDYGRLMKALRGGSPARILTLFIQKTQGQ